MTVRMFEIDAQGHLAGSAYVDYANEALWNTLQGAGVDVQAVLAAGIGPVILETRIIYRRELRAGASVDIDCSLSFGTGRTYTVECQFSGDGGALVAQVTSTCGLLDLDSRVLLPEPATHWRGFATHPDRIGL